jgi:hypothetical protein
MIHASSCGFVIFLDYYNLNFIYNQLLLMFIQILIHSYLILSLEV